MYKQYSGLTFDQIYIFLEAAKFENFSKAALSLHITQSAVSRNIATMEDVLGIVLFVRHQRTVRLTNAGAMLAKEFEQIANQTATILKQAYQIQGNQFNNFSVCSFNVLNNTDYLYPIILNFQEMCPGIHVNLEIMDSFREIDLLIKRTYEVGIVPTAHADYLRQNGLKVTEIRKDIPCVLLSSRHPMYGCSESDIPELIKSPIAVIADSNNLFSDWISSVLNNLHLPCGELVHVSNTDTAIAMVEMGTHIILCSKTMHFRFTDDIQSVPINSVPDPGGLSIAYNDSTDNIYIRKFVALVEKTGWNE